jgi:NAD(P)-dependent dehydrogenase (short-subunit alcohol dehydrogenase family)
MIRRDLLKSLGVAAAGGAGGLTLAQAQAQAQEGTQEGAQADPGFEGYATPWDPADPDVPGRQNIEKLSEDYFLPGRFDGKTVIVTGSARGLGAVTARRLAREGANVVGVDILEETGTATIDAIVREGGSATFVAGDIADDATSAEMVRVAVETYGGLDAAINNAGVVDALFPEEEIDFVNQRDRLLAPLHEAGDEYWNRVMAVNASGVFYSMRHELRQFMAQQRGGAIVNVASVAGIIGFGSTCSYVASKHAVQGLTKTAAIDYAPYGIRVNSVGMHVMQTPMLERSIETLNQRRQTDFVDTGLGLYKSQSLLQFCDQNKRGSTAAEQAAIMLFLISPEASNITGATYGTDGGFTAF